MTQPRSVATVPRSPRVTGLYGERSIDLPVDASIAIAKPSLPFTPDRSVGIGVAARMREKNIAGLSSHERAKTKRIKPGTKGNGLYSLSVARVASRSCP